MDIHTTIRNIGLNRMKTLWELDCEYGKDSVDIVRNIVNEFDFANGWDRYTYLLFVLSVNRMSLI